MSALFVSKRLQAAAAAILVVMLVQAIDAIAERPAGPTHAGAVRVAITP